MVLNVLLTTVVFIIKSLILIYIYTYSDINIQSRCCNIKHNLQADSHVGYPTANTKAIQKLLSFSKRMQSTI